MRIADLGWANLLEIERALRPRLVERVGAADADEMDRVDVALRAAFELQRPAVAAGRRHHRVDHLGCAGMKERKPMTGTRAKRLIGVGTAVAPLLAPYALAVATAVRGSWDTYRAGRLGVPPEELARFSGPGGGLHARISHLAERMTELDAGPDAAAKEFAAQTRPRLEELATAVRAAGQMPSQRRRTAFRSIGVELDGIESTLLHHLGVTP